MAQKDVRVEINVNRPAPIVGFGIPLIITGEKALDYTQYSDLDTVGDDFGKESETYAQVLSLLGQEKRVERFAILGVGGGADPITANAITDKLDDVLDQDWRYVIFNSIPIESIGVDLSKWFETVNRLAFYQIGADDAFVDSLIALNFEHTAVLIYPTDDGIYADAAWIGYNAASEPGSTTWKNTRLKGVPALEMRYSQIDAYTSKNIQSVVESTKRVVTTEGKVVSGEYIDIVITKFFIIETIELNVQSLMIDVDKLPYDNRGISQIETRVQEALLESYSRNQIAQDDDGNALYGTRFTPRAEISASQRATRNYKGGTFWFYVAGAIHNAKPIVGELYF